MTEPADPDAFHDGAEDAPLGAATAREAGGRQSRHVAARVVLCAAAAVAGFAAVRAVEADPSADASAGAPTVRGPATPEPTAAPPSMESHPGPAGDALGPLTGVVRSVEGLPIAGVHLRWNHGDAAGAMSADAPAAERRTDDDGRFEFPGALPGRLDVLVRLPPRRERAPDPPPPEPWRHRPGTGVQFDVRLPDGSRPGTARIHAGTRRQWTSWEWEREFHPRHELGAGVAVATAGEFEEFEAGPVPVTGRESSPVVLQLRRRTGFGVRPRAADGFAWCGTNAELRAADGTQLAWTLEGRFFSTLRTRIAETKPWFADVAPSDVVVALSHDGRTWTRLDVDARTSDVVELTAPPPDPTSLVEVIVSDPAGEPCSAQFQWSVEAFADVNRFPAPAERVVEGRYRVLRAPPRWRDGDAESFVRDGEWTLQVDPGRGPRFDVPVPFGVARVDAAAPAERWIVVTLDPPDAGVAGSVSLGLALWRADDHSMPPNSTGVSGRGPTRVGPASPGHSWRVSLVRRRGGGSLELSRTGVELAAQGDTPLTIRVPRLFPMRIEAGAAAARRNVEISRSGQWMSLSFDLDASGCADVGPLPEGTFTARIGGEERTFEVPATQVLTWQ